MFFVVYQVYLIGITIRDIGEFFYDAQCYPVAARDGSWQRFTSMAKKERNICAYISLPTTTPSFYFSTPFHQLDIIVSSNVKFTNKKLSLFLCSFCMYLNTGAGREGRQSGALVICFYSKAILGWVLRHTGEKMLHLSLIYMKRDKQTLGQKKSCLRIFRLILVVFIF